MNKKVLTVREAAKQLGISESLLRLTIRVGKIPFRRGKAGVLIDAEALTPFTDPKQRSRPESPPALELDATAAL